MSMRMTPELYYDAFVSGNYEDFKAHSSCVRRAFNAAVAASHLADHYLTYYKLNDPSKVSLYHEIGDYVEYISSNTQGYFKDVRSIANAYKHLYTGAKPKMAKHSSISSTGSIEAIQLVNEDVDEVCEEPSDQDATHYKVTYTRKSGQKLEFLPVLKIVVDFWEKELS